MFDIVASWQLYNSERANFPPIQAGDRKCAVLKGKDTETRSVRFNADKISKPSAHTSSWAVQVILDRDVVACREGYFGSAGRARQS
jgi:hypothetical protein